MTNSIKTQSPTIIMMFIAGLLITFNANSQVDESPKMEWQLSISLDLAAYNRLYIDEGQTEFDDYFAIGVGIDVYYDNFFLVHSDQFRRNQTNATIGYNLRNSADLTIDLIIGNSYFHGLTEKDGNVYRDEPSKALLGVNERQPDFSQGLRLAYYEQDSAWWIDIAGDVIADSHNGWLIDSYYSRLIPAQNWELQLGIGASYFSKQMTRYYTDVSVAEATLSRPVYRADDGFRVSLDFSAQYALSEQWLFRGGASMSRFSSAFGKSPLYHSNKQFTVHASAVYVW